jgi:hypothetical protein
MLKNQIRFGVERLFLEILFSVNERVGETLRAQRREDMM